MKHNDDFDGIRGQLLATDPLPSFSRAFYVVQQAERQKQITNATMDCYAFMVHNKQVNKMEHGVNRRNKDGIKKFCSHCKTKGHTVENFFEKIGYPDW